MIIAAKFSSVCPVCSQRIQPGSKVEWSKGSPARHVGCAKGAPVSAAPKSDRPKSDKTPCVQDAPYVRTEKWEPCKRAYLPNDVGQVRVAGKTYSAWASLREGATGEPAREGDALVVVAQDARYESAEDADDMGGCDGAGWVVTLYLRRATAEEAAQALARAAERKAGQAAAANRKALITELGRLCEAGMRGCDDAAGKPAGRELELDPGVHGSGRRVAVLSEDGAGVAIWCSGYYDDYRQTLCVTREPRAVEILALLGVAS